MHHANWDDLHTPDQWAEVLDEMAEEAARRGAYTDKSNLTHAAECIRHLVVLVDAGAELATEAENLIDELRRKTKAAIESLGKPQ